jgi:hypothetical protein
VGRRVRERACSWPYDDEVPAKVERWYVGVDG